MMRLSVMIIITLLPSDKSHSPQSAWKHCRRNEKNIFYFLQKEISLRWDRPFLTWARTVHFFVSYSILRGSRTRARDNSRWCHYDIYFTAHEKCHNQLSCGSGVLRWVESLREGHWSCSKATNVSSMLMCWVCGASMRPTLKLQMNRLTKKSRGHDAPFATVH